MILLSRIYKSIQYKTDQKKVINHIQKISNMVPSLDLEVEQEESKNDEQMTKVDQILKDAEEMAERMLYQTKIQIEEMKGQAKREIEDWWEYKRQEDANLIEIVKKDGFQSGYEEGLKNAEAKMQEQYLSLFDQAQKILKEAYQLKEQIISEAEPILVDLSVSIAQKIILKEIEMNPDIIKAITKEALKQTKELEKITINVSPNHFAYLHNARDELLLELHGQVELLIFPDPTIDHGGCVIRNSSGTLDARIDTQLEEIKQVLMDVIGRRME
ncbi:flagellar assembly protein H [Tepidibacillus sp. HK-1]|nr:flagellar assembly protein H [Tepidibacillus sp. HK-1]